MANLTLSLEEFAHLASVSYVIAAKPGTLSKPMAATCSRAWLERSGAWRPGEKQLAVPVFGLYADKRTTRTGSSRARPPRGKRRQRGHRTDQVAHVGAVGDGRNGHQEAVAAKPGARREAGPEPGRPDLARP